MRDSEIKTIDRMVRDGGDVRNFPCLKGFITNVGGRISAALSIVVIGGILVVKIVDFFCPSGGNRQHNRQSGGRR